MPSRTCDNSALAGFGSQIILIGMKQLVITLLLTLAAVTTASADQNDPRLDAYFDALVETEDAYLLRLVEQQIWEAWREAGDPEVEDIFQEGMRAMSGADFALAIDLFTEAVSLDPDFAEAYNMRATSHFLLGNDFESLTDVRATIDLEPRHFGALMGGAQIAIRSGQAELALEFVEAALKVSPHKEGWQRLAERLRDMTGSIDL